MTEQRDGRSQVAGLLAAMALLATPVAAQVAVEAVRTADGQVLELPENGAWRGRARQVAALRAALKVQDDFARLNAGVMAGAPSSAAAALTGTMLVPAVLFGFRDTDTTVLARAPRYDSLYFGATPPTGRSYSLRSFYREMSNDLLDVQGSALGWVLGDSAAAFYLGACGGSLNALDCTTGRNRLHALFRASLGSLDPGTDFGLYDNDGPDGVPNSGDDDGFVDVVQFVQPVVGGECGGAGVWAHRWFLTALGGSAYVTGDPRTGGGLVQVNSYFIGSGVGGAGPGNRQGCASPTQISGIGTMAHEFGHALGLPDLYDTGGGTEGIGEWGLMGSGSYTSANSPTHLEGWSKERLGWVAVVPLSATGSYTIPPVVSRDTVFLVRPPRGVTNPRGEYFLLENRQALGSDTANIVTGGQAGPKNGGVLLWHVDSVKVLSSGGVNFGSIHGVALEQADGLGHLDLLVGGNRGDGGDPYPGSSGRTVFSSFTNPAAVKNADGAFVGFTLDSVRQVVAGGEMAFRLWFGSLFVTAVGPGTVLSAPSVPMGTLLSPGTVVALIAKPAAGAILEGWSGDTSATGDTLVLTINAPTAVAATFVPQLVSAAPAPANAVMGATYSLSLSVSGGTGAYSWVLLSGALPRGVTLKPNGVISGVPEVTGGFAATVQVTSGGQTRVIPVSLTVTAPALTTSAVLGVLLGTGGTLTADERRYLDLLGNRNTRLDVGDFHAFIATTGGAVSAEMMAALLGKEGAR